MSEFTCNNVTEHLHRGQAHVRQQIGPPHYVCACGKSYLSGATEWDNLSEFRCLVIHQHEPARQRAPDLANTPEFVAAQRQRKKVEALFAELKNQIGLRRLRLRRLKFVREQFFLAAAAQNLKRLMRFLSKAPTAALAATASLIS